MTLNNVRIGALHINAINFVVTGLIIGKSNMATFEKGGTQGKPQTSMNGVVKFTIRDSCDHFINVTVWGTAEYIKECNSKFEIGLVVKVINSKISSVRHDDTFNPITSSQYQLTINEGFGSIEFNDGTELIKLLNVPLKSPDLALNLADVASSPPTASDAGNLVDLFVVVAKIKPTRQIGNKFVRDVIVIDQTVTGMYMTIWNQAWIKRSESWNEMSTVLHLINVCYKHSEYHKSIVLVTQSRTIIVAEPTSERTKSLKEYAQNSALILTDLDTSEPDLAAIKTIMSVQQVMDRLNDASGDPVFYSLTYAVVTQMDIDGWTQFYSKRCIHCNCQIKTSDTSCDKEDCSMFFAENPLDQHFINYFNIPVHLTDHTGTLDRCRLVGDAAERILGYSLNEFLRMSDEDRSSIKWKFLMERCSVKLSIKRKTALRWNTQINIVDCHVASVSEVMDNIKCY